MLSGPSEPGLLTDQEHNLEWMIKLGCLSEYVSPTHLLISLHQVSLRTGKDLDQEPRAVFSDSLLKLFFAGLQTIG